MLGAHRKRNALLAALAAMPAALGCTESTTRLVLLVSADDEVRAQASAVRLHVTGGRAPQTTEFDEVLALEDPSRWPLDAVLVPMGGDATRPIAIELEALDASMRAVSRIDATLAFELGRTSRVTLRFEADGPGDRCPGACGPGLTCEDGRCVASPPDAGVPSDAATCMPRESYADRDGDGYGDPGSAARACELAPGRVMQAGDCDDACVDCRPGGTETCDGSRDEDCDRRIDESCECRLLETRLCPDGRDVCARGVQTCIGGRWGDCVGRVEAQSEECNARDEDCDGRIDEDLRRGCERGCHQTCVLGIWGDCRDRDGDRCERDDD